MRQKIQGSAPFQVLAANFSISPSNEGYTLQISADGENYSDLFAVGAGQTRMVTGVANGSYYRLNGNNSEVVINWVPQCNEGGGSGSGSTYILPPASENVLGGVKIGSGISVEADGTISVSGGSAPADVTLPLGYEAFDAGAGIYYDEDVELRIVSIDGKETDYEMVWMPNGYADESTGFIMGRGWMTAWNNGGWIPVYLEPGNYAIVYYKEDDQNNGKVVNIYYGVEYDSNRFIKTVNSDGNGDWFGEYFHSPIFTVGKPTAIVLDGYNVLTEICANDSLLPSAMPGGEIDWNTGKPQAGEVRAVAELDYKVYWSTDEYEFEDWTYTAHTMYGFAADTENFIDPFRPAKVLKVEDVEMEIAYTNGLWLYYITKGGETVGSEKLFIYDAVNQYDIDSERSLIIESYTNVEAGAIILRAFVAENGTPADRDNVETKGYAVGAADGIYQYDGNEWKSNSYPGMAGDFINAVDNVIPRALVDLNERKVESESVHTIWRGTQAEYDDLDEYDAATLYIIINN